MNQHTFDVIVIGSGTSAYYAIDGLNQTGKYKIAVIDERPYGGTCDPRVYGIGDCAATPYMLATVADKEGQTVVDNILEGNTHRIDYSVVPSTVFTIPSIGSVGLSEEEAIKSGIDIRINKGTTTGWPSSKRIGEAHSAYKVIIDNTTDLILGAHIARHNGSEVINVFGLAIKFNIKASELADFLWAYPTYSSDLKYMVK